MKNFNIVYYTLLNFIFVFKCVVSFRAIHINSPSALLNSAPINQFYDSVNGFKLIQLPYNAESLSPFMSKSAVETHYLKHHAKYVNKLSELLDDRGVPGLSLEDLMVNTSNKMIYNNAAQTYNHNLFWYSITPEINSPDGEFLSAINASFGSPDNLLSEIVAKGVAHFGSGWIYLTKLPDGKLVLYEGHDADSPIRTKLGKPLLALDIWEHAYYLDYRSDREKYIMGWVEHINWEFARYLYNSKPY